MHPTHNTVKMHFRDRNAIETFHTPRVISFRIPETVRYVPDYPKDFVRARRRIYQMQMSAMLIPEQQGGAGGTER